jgi:hypothetical protein
MINTNEMYGLKHDDHLNTTRLDNETGQRDWQPIIREFERVLGFYFSSKDK